MRVLITGINGYFAGELIKQLNADKNIEIIGVTSHPEKISNMGNPRIAIVEGTSLFNEEVTLPQVDIIVHTAFCRKSNGRLLVESLEYFTNLVYWTVRHEVKGFINLSSQSVYGSEKEELPKEDGILNPSYLYAFAKYSSEHLMKEIAADRFIYTNVRLASLVGPSESVPNNVLCKFICSGLEGKEFKVVGGKQNFSFLDVRDAAEAVCKIIALPVHAWEKTYNLGPEKQTNIIEMADCVCKKVYEITGKRISYKFVSDDTYLNAGMNSSKLYEAIHWRPKYSFEMITEDTIKFLMRNGGL